MTTMQKEAYEEGRIAWNDLVEAKRCPYEGEHGERHYWFAGWYDEHFGNKYPNSYDEEEMLIWPVPLEDVCSICGFEFDNVTVVRCLSEIWCQSCAGDSDCGS